VREKCANSQLWEKPQFVRLFLCAPRQLKELGKNTPHRMQAKTLAAEITSALLYQLSYTGPATRSPARTAMPARKNRLCMDGKGWPALSLKTAQA
jgi:hypothetical protein